MVTLVIAGEAAASPYSFTPPKGWKDASARVEPMLAEQRANARREQADYDAKAFGDDGVELLVIEHMSFRKFAASPQQLAALETSAQTALERNGTARDYALHKGPRLWKSTQRAKLDDGPITIWRYLGFIGNGTHVIVATCMAADATCDQVLAALRVPEAPFRNLANLAPIGDDDDGPPTWLPWGSGVTSLLLAGLFVAYARQKRKRKAES